jgi:protein-tyrosine kinase
MSTIEKAMEKLGQLAEKEPLPRDVVETGKDDIPGMDSARAESMGGAVQTEQLATGIAEGSQAELGTRNRINLDWKHLTAMGIINPHGEHSTHISEQFRNIKRPLLTHINGLAASPVTHPNLIMVTSSISGEGKTFTSINLAMSLAMEMEKSVLLIDADVAKPEVSNRLGVQAKAGFTDVLLGKVSLRMSSSRRMSRT